MYSSYVCSDGATVDMCPLCDKNCGYWKLNETCLYAKITYLFSNNFTVIFAFLMSVWGKLVVYFCYIYFIHIVRQQLDYTQLNSLQRKKCRVPAWNFWIDGFLNCFRAVFDKGVIPKRTKNTECTMHENIECYGKLVRVLRGSDEKVGYGTITSFRVYYNNQSDPYHIS